jgi:gliding motility-associated-like protein
MKINLVIIFSFFSSLLFGQITCNTSGNLVIYSNYDGGILTINIDQNIPNLKVGICTYEPIQVSFTGAFVGNITQVIYAGFNSIQNNNNCSQGNFITSVTGVPTGIISILTNPQVGYTPTHGNGSGTWGGGMIGVSGQCDTLTDAGGGNTPDEVVYYFQQATGGQLLFHKTQYACWLNETVNITAGGNCCILPPNLCNLNAFVSVVQNTICEPCSYNGPPILINELMISPTTGDGSISGPGGISSGRGEWIELYNPDLCDSVDISCYYLGNSTVEGTGGFRLPSGTIIPPNGFAMIRGEYAAPVPSNLLLANGGNVVEIVVPLEITGPGVCCSGTRVWFPNLGGWFAFYDANGNPIDAVSWGPGNTASLAGNPCISNSNSCNVGSLLSSYNSIPSNLKFYASPAEGGTHAGSSIRRFPDGQNWQGVGSPTYAICNDPNNCLTGTSVGFCNGQGTVTTLSGVAPFTYQWNDDLNQTTQTATNLCEGSYQVIVSDANNCSDTLLVNVITIPFDLSTNIQQPGCLQSNGTISIDPYDPSYSYIWTPNVSSSNSASNLTQGTYNIVISQGFCTLDTTIVLQNPVPFSTSVSVNQTTCGNDNGVIVFTNTPSGNYTYLWTNAISTTNSASGITPGQYQISITDNICIFDTSIVIQPSIGLNSTAQTLNSSCEQNNGAINLTISPPGTYSFYWNPNVSNSANGIELLAGTYAISYTDGLCSNDTIISLLTTPLPSLIQSTFSNPNCGLENGNMLINGAVGGTAPYSYSFNGLQVQENDSILNIGIGNYPITVIDGNGCSYTQTSSFIMTSGISNIFIPNVLTANNDLTNDLWKIQASCIDKMECQILNRWGNKIFEFDNLDAGWNGKTSDGFQVEEGVYFYKVTFYYFGDDKEEGVFHGHITVIR